jgi:hypothetical protein
MLTPFAGPGELSEMDRFVFDSWGFLVIPNVLSEPQVAACLSASQWLHLNAGTEAYGQVGRGYEVEPTLAELIDHPAVLPKVRGLYGDRFVLQAGWNTKQSAGSAAGGWHQDGSDAYDFKNLGQPVPLVQLRAAYLLADQSEPGNGNLEIVPGSHHSSVGLPRSVADSDQSPTNSLLVCAPAGSVLLFHNALWHRASAHDGSVDRYIMHYVYSPPWVRPADRLANAPEFLARSTPMRRALMGEFERPDQPYGRSYEPLPFS